MSHASTYVFVGAAVLFTLYRRIRRTVGLQRIAPRSMWTRIALFGVICALFLVSGLTHPVSLLADAVGAAAGAAIAVAALRSTAFERRDDAWYYRTHTWIGLGVSAIFVVRLVYRFALLQSAFTAPGAAGPANLQFGSYAADPVTTGVYFLVAAYYGVYYILIMQRARA